MTDEGILGMRRAYAANVSVIDHEVGRILDALDDRGVLDDTWVIYTSDHGEMGGDHGHMSKCVLYDGAVRVPLLVRPPGGAGACAGAVVEDLVEHVDVPATIRAAVGAGDVPESEGRSLLGHLVPGADRPEARSVVVSENWGFASFETEAYKLVVDEDALVPGQLFDRVNDPNEDDNLITDPASADVVGRMMDEIVKPFFTVPPVRNHPSFFTS
jgi:arylsulfatase A-like enzyme